MATKKQPHLRNRVYPEDKELTPQEEVFVDHHMEGNTYVDSFLKAYPHSHKWKRGTLRTRSSELASRNYIRRAIRERKHMLAQEGVWRRIDSAYALIDTYNRATQEGSHSNAIQAIKELNQMHGYNEPQQINVNHTLPQTIRLIAVPPKKD